jgi:hypothetical protein
VVTDWRLPVPPDVTESIFWQAAGPLIGGGEPSAVLLAGMMVLAADEMLVNLADTPANRAFVGSTGTAEAGPAEPPRARAVGRVPGGYGKLRTASCFGNCRSWGRVWGDNAE